MTGHQAPIFRRQPELAAVAATPIVEAGSEKPWFVPLGIFVARKDEFDFILRDHCGPHEARNAAFDKLPLAENGWLATEQVRIGTTQDGFPIWRMTRR